MRAKALAKGYKKAKPVATMAKDIVAYPNFRLKNNTLLNNENQNTNN